MSVDIGPIKSNFEMDHIKDKKRTIVVVIAFYASVVSFVAAGFYDFTRPFILSQLFRVVDKIACILSLPTTSSAIIFAEAFILVPVVLSVLPLTTFFWKRNKNATTNISHAPSESSIESSITEKNWCFVLKLLEAISWSLWSVAALALVAGLVLGPHLFGCISFSALLALFAQGIGAVGILWDQCKEDDDIRRECVATEMSNAASSLSADAWVHKQEPAKFSTVSKKLSTTGENDCFSHSLSSFMKSMGLLSDSDAIPSRRNLNIDFLIFFLMNTGLLQSPYYLQVGFHHGGVHVSIPKEILSAMTFVATILVPLLTHGVGGRLFGGQGWSFHHPFQGGKNHVTAQATGWSLLSFAALLHLSFMILGMDNQHVYLLHSGSILAWFAEVTLLCSLLNFRSTSTIKNVTTSRKPTEILKSPEQTLLWFIFGCVQDLMLTNMHWLYTLWLFGTMMGFNLFSSNPMKKFLNISFFEAGQNTVLLICVWSLPYLFIPYSSRMKEWRWNPFGLINLYFLKFVFHPNGVFRDSKLKLEEKIENYQRGGAMFAMMPHGTLPTSVLAVWHQFEHIFSDVCVFFGSQVGAVPGYRLLNGLRGGCLPIEKKRVIEVMRTGQNISLVPGGVSEMLKCVPHANSINVSIKHKGFVRLAIQEGYDLVPTFFFHANDQYNSPMRKLQTWTYKLMGYPVGVPLFTNKWFFPISNRNPIRVALGRRIAVDRNPNPTQEEVDAVHRKFYEEVARIWEKHKDEFGYGDRELTYVI